MEGATLDEAASTAADLASSLPLSSSLLPPFLPWFDCAHSSLDCPSMPRLFRATNGQLRGVGVEAGRSAGIAAAAEPTGAGVEDEADTRVGADAGSRTASVATSPAAACFAVASVLSSLRRLCLRHLSPVLAIVVRVES